GNGACSEPTYRRLGLLPETSCLVTVGGPLTERRACHLPGLSQPGIQGRVWRVLVGKFGEPPCEIAKQEWPPWQTRLPPEAAPPSHLTLAKAPSLPICHGIGSEGSRTLGPPQNLPTLRAAFT